MAMATNNDSTEVPPPIIEPAMTKPIKKICLILISFIPAVVLLSITNAIFAHVFVATAILFPSSNNANEKDDASQSPPPLQKKKKKATPPPKKVITKTIYVAPTKEDLDRILQELETSDPLPPIVSDKHNQRSVERIQASINVMNKLLKQRDREVQNVTNGIEEVAQAYESFNERFEQEISQHESSESSSAAMTPNAIEHYLKSSEFTSLRDLLGRATFMDLDRQELIQLFDEAMVDLEWLVHDKGEDVDPRELALLQTVLQNKEDSLLKALLVHDAATEAEGNATIVPTCPTSYLALEEGEPSSEFIPPKKQVIMKRAKKKSKTPPKPKAKAKATPLPPHITKDTARESDLYELVENIQQILSRRDLASFKHDEVMPSPIDEDGVEDIRSSIAPVAVSIRKRWASTLAQEGNMREYWVGRTQALMDGLLDNINNNNPVGGGGHDDRGMCANSELVEAMISGGLEAFRTKGDLKQSLKGTALAAVTGDNAKEHMLMSAMGDVFVPEIDYSDNGVRMTAPTGVGTSSWKVGKKSISYAIEGPLLHRGVVGWIDYLVDAISGYNDHLDALLDWMVGEEGVSVGTSVVNGISKMARKIPFLPEEYVDRVKKGGVLAGRMRGILEE